MFVGFFLSPIKIKTKHISFQLVTVKLSVAGAGEGHLAAELEADVKDDLASQIMPELPVSLSICTHATCKVSLHEWPTTRLIRGVYQHLGHLAATSIALVYDSIRSHLDYRNNPSWPPKLSSL